MEPEKFLEKKAGWIAAHDKKTGKAVLPVKRTALDVLEQMEKEEEKVKEEKAKERVAPASKTSAQSGSDQKKESAKESDDSLESVQEARFSEDEAEAKKGPIYYGGQAYQPGTYAPQAVYESKPAGDFGYSTKGESAQPVLYDPSNPVNLSADAKMKNTAEVGTLL